MSKLIKVSEIFASIQGESTLSGLRFGFVRLFGCSLDCTWCDTRYARIEEPGFVDMSFRQILDRMKYYKVKHVLVTGGEPLEQALTPELLSFLADKGYLVSLETNGERPVSGLDSRIKIVMDIKTPSSGIRAGGYRDNIEHLKPSDEIKFVIADRKDYDWMLKVLKNDIEGVFSGEILLSPLMTSGEDMAVIARDLASWMLQDGLDARLQLQLHRIIWGDKKGV